MHSMPTHISEGMSMTQLFIFQNIEEKKKVLDVTTSAQGKIVTSYQGIFDGYFHAWFQISELLGCQFEIRGHKNRSSLPEMYCNSVGMKENIVTIIIYLYPLLNHPNF